MTSLTKLVGKLASTPRRCLENAAGACLSRTHYTVEIEHWLDAALQKYQTDLGTICKSFNADPGVLGRQIQSQLDSMKTGNSRTPSLSSNLILLLQYGWLEASLEFGAKRIRTGHLVLVLLDNVNLSSVRQALPALAPIDPLQLRGDFDKVLRNSPEIDGDDSQQETPPIDGPPARRPGSARVFVSYRHDDSPLFAEAIANRLLAAGFQVFRDADTLTAGALFEANIRKTIEACDALIVVIGKKWVRGSRTAPRRLDDPNDFVRIEIELGLTLNKVVVPCLVGGSGMPSSSDLPESLVGLLKRHALTITDRHFQADLQSLVDDLKKYS